MFAAVSLESFRERVAGRPFYTRFLARLLRAPCSLGEIDHEGVRFYVLHALADRWGMPDWDAVEKAARENGVKRLLLPEGLRAPERLFPMLCDSVEYRRLYCLRVARHLARAAQIPPARLCVGLLDPEGHTDHNLAMRALAFAGRVVVVTRNPAHFADLGEWAVKGVNSPLVITESVRALDACQLILAPFGVNGVCTSAAEGGMGAECAFAGLLVSALPVPVSWRGLSVDSFSPVLPETLAALRPPGISALAFAAALWKEEGLVPLGRLPVGTVYSRGRALDPSAVSEQLRHFPTTSVGGGTPEGSEIPGSAETSGGVDSGD